MKPINVGLLGIGTVGGGTFTVLTRNQEVITRRAGRPIRIVKVADRDVARAREITKGTVEVTDDAFSVVNDPDIDIVVELIGGYTVARELVLKAIENGKHVVTANKALLAVHGNEIFAAAQKKGVMVAFEAAVAGGIPIIKALREGLTANRIEWIAGIINGTTNFILTEMREKGLDFDVALKEAQRLGYAEADPTFDVEGIDAAHKLTIMAAIAFGIPMQFDKAYTEGISKLTGDDIRYAEELGYRVKLLGITKHTEKGVELRVHPALIPEKRLIANVNGAMNAVLVKGDAVGPTLYYGAGAGAEPTASSVIADLVDVTRMHTSDPHHRVPHLAFQPDQLSDLPILPMDEVRSAYYLRLRALDKPGVLAEVTRILADLGISIDAMMQKEPAEGEDQADIIILTHITVEKNINRAIAMIEALPTIAGKVIRIRMEELGKMKYVSTRGNSPAQSFCEILLGGLAPDGGLYLPESYPKFSEIELAAMRGMNYRELAFTILSRFADDIPVADLRDIINRTYTAEVYCHVREGQNAEDITPTLKLEDGLFLLSLSNGPTLAFKDMAMQLLGNLFEYVLAKTGRETNILGATSGDTGSSAEYAMRGKHGIRVFMLSPHQKMSRFQTAQMFSLQDPNIYNIAVKGVFDDCQDIVKAVSNDHAFKAQHKIGAVNSINWGRVVAQVIYYFKGYFAVTRSNDERVSFAVPSGNFGNVCAGHIARMLGLPIHQLIVATNENDVLDEFFRTGEYRPRDAAHTYHTSSPSMDISKASNFERFVFDLVGRDGAKVRELWGRVDSGGAFDLNQGGYFAKVADYGFVSGSSNHEMRMKMIRWVNEEYGITIDTHTADGLKVALEHREPGAPLVVLETALPVKFEDAILEALGHAPDRPADLVGLEQLPQRFEVMDADVEAVKRFVIAHTTS